jgi:hypothetical protein
LIANEVKPENVSLLAWQLTMAKIHTKTQENGFIVISMHCNEAGNSIKLVVLPKCSKVDYKKQLGTSTHVLLADFGIWTHIQIPNSETDRRTNCWLKVRWPDE